MQLARIAAVVLSLVGGPSARADELPRSPVRVPEPIYRSHPPTRPLPIASGRASDAGRAFFVHAGQGDDQNDGGETRPWRTIAHAAKQLQPGDSLYLRGAVYYEHLALTASGSAERPITIRSFPGELAVLDGGLREFAENAATAWEPCPSGVEGEFWSTRVYPELGGSAGHVTVLGHFADSMVPLHGYRFLADSRRVPRHHKS